jgi:Ca-activated chloride channel homolog
VTHAELLPDFTFLRPIWLLGLLPGLALCWLLFQRSRSGSGWESVIPGRWQQLLLDGRRARTPGPFLLLALGVTMGVVALAGPAVRSPVHLAEQNQSSVVVVLDLSRNICATVSCAAWVAESTCKVMGALSAPSRPRGGITT